VIGFFSLITLMSTEPEYAPMDLVVMTFLDSKAAWRLSLEKSHLVWETGNLNECEVPQWATLD